MSLGSRYQYDDCKLKYISLASRPNHMLHLHVRHRSDDHRIKYFTDHENSVRDDLLPLFAASHLKLYIQVYM